MAGVGQDGQQVGGGQETGAQVRSGRVDELGETRGDRVAQLLGGQSEREGADVARLGVDGGSAGVVISNSGIAGGASGAVFGLMAAATVSMHRQGINILQTGIGRTLMLNLVLTFVLSSYISVGGHVGGIVAGSLCSLAMMAPRWKPVPKWAIYATPIAIGVISVLISVRLGLRA